MGTGVQTEDEIDRFLALTDPELVFLLFDSGHLTFAGVDPVPVLQKYIGRTRHVHLKDVRLPVRDQARREGWSFLTAVRNGVFTVPGEFHQQCGINQFGSVQMRGRVLYE